MKKGENTKNLIVDQALSEALVKGLEAVSIGSLAKQVGLSKSGLFAHFQSKEVLQLAVVEEAISRFEEIVVRPGLKKSPGLSRLKHLFERHLKWVSGELHPGGCPFVGLIQEYDRREGAIRDLLAASEQKWRLLLRQCISEAQAAGEIPADVEPDQLVFELVGAVLAYQVATHLLGDQQAYQQSLSTFGRITGKAP